MTKAPAMTLAEVAKLRPCQRIMKLARKVLPPRRKITVRMAIEAGIDLEDVIWVLDRKARTDADIFRRLLEFERKFGGGRYTRDTWVQWACRAETREWRKHRRDHIDLLCAWFSDAPPDGRGQ